MTCYGYHGLGGPWVGFYGFSSILSDIRRVEDDLPSDEALMLRPW